MYNIFTNVIIISLKEHVPLILCLLGYFYADDIILSYYVACTYSDTYGINLSLGLRPSPGWRRPPGRPPNRCLDQIRTDTGFPSATAWRNAIRRGHHPGATQRLQLATRQ